MNDLKRKLNSQRGASITYALLIFLVCAVVGSAVLVAGTTAAGRMSKITENDQRYYAVTSAVRLLSDLIDDKTVTVVKEQEEGAAATTTFTDENGVTNTSKSLLLHTVEKAMSDSPTCTGGHNLSVAGYNNLAVDVQDVYTDENGDSLVDAMTLTVKSNITFDPGTEKEITGEYAIELSFNLDRNDVVDVIEAKTTTEKTKTVTTSSCTWHLRNIEVIGAKRWAS